MDFASCIPAAVYAGWAVILGVTAFRVSETRRPTVLSAGIGLWLLTRELALSYDPRRGAVYGLLMGLAGLGFLGVVLFCRREQARRCVETPSAPARPEPGTPAAPEPSEGSDRDSLLARFQTLLVEERIFLQPQLTLDVVADRLHTNKTYVSRMVNDHYKVSFPELISALRVDYAEQYILRHRDARQEEVAAACGFVSASSFNNTFKKVTGMPPRQWVTSWDATHPDR